jgi:hypothetical protein
MMRTPSMAPGYLRARASVVEEIHRVSTTMLFSPDTFGTAVLLTDSLIESYGADADIDPAVMEEVLGVAVAVAAKAHDVDMPHWTGIVSHGMTIQRFRSIEKNLLEGVQWNVSSHTPHAIAARVVHEVCRARGVDADAEAKLCAAAMFAVDVAFASPTMTGVYCKLEVGGAAAVVVLADADLYPTDGAAHPGDAWSVAEMLGVSKPLHVRAAAMRLEDLLLVEDGDNPRLPYIAAWYRRIRLPGATHPLGLAHCVHLDTAPTVQARENINRVCRSATLSSAWI